MKDLIRRILKEEIIGNLSTGCDYFHKKSYDYQWCKYIAEKSLSKNTRIASNAISIFKKEFLSEYKEGLRATKYNKEHPFFTDRRKVVATTLGKFKNTCPKLYNYIIERMKKYSQDFVILNAKGEYDLLNKLNTNWSALALLLTSQLPEKYKDLKEYSFLQAQKYFFQQKDDEGLTPFEKFMGTWEQENSSEIREKIYNTIISKSKEGQNIENEFFEYIKNYVNAEQFAGEYSFLDMIGIDMIIETPEGNWIPVQVKKYAGACNADENSGEEKLSYRDYMCENWCVSYEEKTWRIKTFKGRTMQKNKVQCKNMPLNMTCFLNVHTHETDIENEFCVTDPEKLHDIDF